MHLLKPAVSAKDHVQGPVNAPVALVEYGDYECSHCGVAYSVIRRIQQAMGEQLKFVFRNFPLSEIHPNAMNAAVASEAAAGQGKFWEMHDYLFQHQSWLDDASLVRYAAHLGLDVDRFILDFESPDLIEKVENDFESGVRSGVNGTPSFYVNGEKYTGSWDEAALLERLQSLVS